MDALHTGLIESGILIGLIDDMLLTEPGSTVVGPTSDVLRLVFESAWNVLRDEMGDNAADQVCLRIVQVAHEELTGAGWVCRVLAPGL